MLLYKYSTAFDVFTDLLVLSIPVFILRAVRLPWRRKVLVGFLLCLSGFVMVVSIIRVSLIILSNGTPDT